MQRRNFIMLGGAAAVSSGLLPPTALGQEAGGPVVGYLYTGSPEVNPEIVTSFRKGLSEMGYVEGRNLTIEYRYAYGQTDRLPELAAGLVQRRVAAIAALPNAAALAAKAATTSIPVIFYAGGDAVQSGLVARLNRPGGNVTGINSMQVDIAPKRLGLLHELLPHATRFGLLVSSI